MTRDEKIRRIVAGVYMRMAGGIGIGPRDRIALRAKVDEWDDELLVEKITETLAHNARIESLRDGKALPTRATIKSWQDANPSYKNSFLVAWVESERLKPLELMKNIQIPKRPLLLPVPDQSPHLQA